ncbi:hypothetical protein LINGRAPRIM_LOCUS2476 [Linum grandiflorum]
MGEVFSVKINTVQEVHIF